MRLYFLLVFFLPFVCFSQPTRQPDAAQIHLKIKKLNFLGSVLYLAAHPDDENTNVIAYLSNEKLATTAYLSLTRGDGGQNLIGPEIREMLGLIRTQELLAARRIDGGQQFFTRAIDFGFSKSAAEAFSIWGKEAVLSDAIKVVRQFQPDIIITRFPPDERAGHGHHTASAMVAGEAFDLAVKNDIFPDQVKEFGTWQVKRLYTNTGRWWNRTVDENTAGVISLDVGGYNTLLGKSYSEISALSSSQHKSQGWGRKGERGYRPELLEHVKGLQATKNIFEGIDTTWNRVPGGRRIQPLIHEVLTGFDAQNPAASVPLLFRVRNEIKKLPSGVWRDRKLKETEELIVDCLGLFVEVTASGFHGAPGETIMSTIELLNRSNADLHIKGMQAAALQWDSVFTTKLIHNKPQVISISAKLDASAGFSDPYWLQAAHPTGLFTVSDKDRIGMPENPPAVEFTFDFLVGGQELSLRRPLIYKWVDPVKGELWRPFEIVPPVTINLSETVMVFGTAEPRQVSMLIRSSSDEKQAGMVELRVPQGWRVDPVSVSFELSTRGQEQTKTITVSPSSSDYNGTLKAVATVGEKQYDRALQIISYDHLPVQTLLPASEVKAVRIDLKKEGQRVGYIRGAGDDIPSALRNMGYEVWEMNNDEITSANLKNLDAVVLGVRALNTNDRARFFMPVVLEYVKEGGTVISQYNTNSRMQTENFAPYALTIGRQRVSDETAEVRVLKKDHPVLNTPNKISAADFNGWIQERGLYFPSEWDERFEAILSMNDPGEDPINSSLLVAQYGKGHYVYTGLSFFRELPEGVAGAYKLFANLVSLGKGQPTESSRTKNRSR